MRKADPQPARVVPLLSRAAPDATVLPVEAGRAVASPVTRATAHFLRCRALTSTFVASCTAASLGLANAQPLPETPPDDTASEEPESTDWDGAEQRFRGPFEVIHGFTMRRAGRIDSPRSAVPETRVGIYSSWERRFFYIDDPHHDDHMDSASLLVEGQVAFPAGFEVALDGEVYRYVHEDYDTQGVDQTTETVGGWAARVKWNFASGSWFDVAADLEGVIWSGPPFGLWDCGRWSDWEVGLGFHAALRPHSRVTINLSLPTVVEIWHPVVWLAPAGGVAVFPWEFLGLVADFQARVYAVDPPAVVFRLAFGVRIRPLDQMLAEIAGTPDPQGRPDGGIIARVAWTPPDFF